MTLRRSLSKVSTLSSREELELEGADEEERGNECFLAMVCNFVSRPASRAIDELATDGEADVEAASPVEGAREDFVVLEDGAGVGAPYPARRVDSGIGFREEEVREGDFFPCLEWLDGLVIVPQPQPRRCEYEGST